MQTLLPAIQAVLQGLLQLPRRGDCYITPHLNYMPTGTRQPCIGIKDGGISRVELAGEEMELTARVDLAGFVRMTGDGFEAVCGPSGVYQLLDDATAELINNRLGLADVLRVQIGTDKPTELFQADNKQWIVKLVRTLVYTLERPSV
jgi:hypothetical protein